MHDTCTESHHNAKGHAVGKKNPWGESVGNANCDLVRPIIIGRNFTVNNFIGIAWTRQGTKKVTKDDKIVIEIEEPMRKKTLTMTRKVTIPPRSYAMFDIKGEEWEGKYEIRPNPFLKQREPNLWMDNFCIV